MTDDRITFDAAQRAVIEDWQRSAMEYGWKVAHIGLPKPDPLFTWRDGIPEVVADGAAMEAGS